jgi:flagellar basal-body rod modification protein FlgD
MEKYMDISSVTSSSAVSNDIFGAGNEVMGKEDFLRILVTQLQNQDPIDPMKSEDFASQLAEFSSLEQLQNLNATVASTAELDVLLNQSLTNTLAASFIGNDVRALGNSVQYSDGKPRLQYSLPITAQNVSIDIMDENGVVLRTVDLSGQTDGDHTYEWDGLANDGTPLQEGKFTFRVNATDLNGGAFSGDPYISGTVTSVRYFDGAAWLQLGDTEVSMSNVVEISQTSEKE